MTVHEGTRSLRAESTTAADLRRRAETATIIRTMIVLFLAAGMVAALTANLSGQQPAYEVKKLSPAYEDPDNVKKMKDAAKRISVTRDAKNFPQRPYAEAFFKVYVPGKITQPDAVDQITPLISEVMLRLSAAQRSDAPLAGTIMQWVYNSLKPIAVGNYHPPGRISAILAISRIDEKPATPADLRQGIPPTPLRYILADFLPIYEDENNPDGVRAAALQGLHRYAMLAGPSITGANLTKLKSLMNDLLTQEPPAGRSAKAHAYLQRFAVDILSVLRGKTDPALGQQLISISTEAKKPDLIALHSAARIGEMAGDLKGQVNDPDQVLQKWAVRAMRAFQYEIIRLKALNRPKATNPQPPKPRSVVRPATEPAAAGTGSTAQDTGAGAGGEAYESQMAMQYEEDSEDSDMGGDAYSMQMMMEGGAGAARRVKAQPPEIFASRRKLNFVLQQLHLGATGQVQAGIPAQPGGLMAAADAQKAAVETWVNSMGEVLTALNDETLEDRKTYLEALQAQVEVLRGIAGPAAEEAEAEAPLEVPNVPSVVAAAAVDPDQPAADDAADSPVVNEAGIPQLPVKDELSFD